MIPFTVIPFEPSLGWQLDLVELEEEASRVYHDHEKRLIVLAEGELSIIDDEDDEEELEAGQVFVLEPRVNYSFVPNGEVKFFLIDFPELHNEYLPLEDDQDFGMKIDRDGYTVYEMITGEETDGLWSAAVIEIEDSPKHFHKIESEVFIVLNGVLSIELNGKRKTLEVGDYIRIPKGAIHHLKCANSDRVRLLCFNFPAFDPADMHFVD